MQKHPVKIEQYEQFVARKRIALAAAAFITLFAAVVYMGIGSLKISLPDIFRALAGEGEKKYQTAIMNIRLPRVLAAIFVGATLAASGAVMQCVLRNPLASASTLGVSQGAAFGAALGIIVFGGGVITNSNSTSTVSIDNPYIVTLCAGGSTLLQYFADDTSLGAVVFWTFGNLGSASWKDLRFISVVFVLSFIYYMYNRWNYNAMEAGYDTAKSLGVDTKKVMVASMAVCSLSAAVAVSFVGIISFVGLIAPHVMRFFVGNDHRFLVPGSAVCGALLLILADALAKLIAPPIILPIGAIMSFIGGPVFLILLFRGRNSNG